MEKQTIQDAALAPPTYAEHTSQPTAVNTSFYPVADHGVYNQPQPNTLPINMMPQTQGFVSVVPVVSVQNRQNLEPFFFGLCRIHPEHRARHWLALVAMMALYGLFFVLKAGFQIGDAVGGINGVSYSSTDFSG